ncbi:hypothetical protein D3C80_1431940 [compost metagenome]
MVIRADKVYGLFTLWCDRHGCNNCIIFLCEKTRNNTIERRGNDLWLHAHAVRNFGANRCVKTNHFVFLVCEAERWILTAHRNAHLTRFFELFQLVSLRWHVRKTCSNRNSCDCNEALQFGTHDFPFPLDLSFCFRVMVCH